VIRSSYRRPANLSSIVWGSRSRVMGDMPLDDGFNLAPRIALALPGLSPGGVVTQGPMSPGLVDGAPPMVALPIPGLSPGGVVLQNPDVKPGTWPGLMPPISVTTLPLQVPIVVTPTSGPIPSPATVQAATAAPASWFDQSLIAGISNKYLLLGGVLAMFLFGSKKS
jgi:hypothetical protein